MPISTTVQEIRKEARKTAATVLEVHWDGMVPVDPILLARALGVSVFNSELDDDTRGMLIGSNGSADIYLNPNQPYVRHRFLCAHALGYYVNPQNDLGPHTGYVYSRNDSNVRSPHEIYAHEFAASLLMPESEFQKAVSSGNSLISIAHDFKVPLSIVRSR